MTKTYFVEFLGTFFLMLVATLSEQNALAIGACWVGLAYWGRSYGGGFYNPSVILANILAKKTAWKHFFPYLLVQVLGAYMGALVYVSVRGFAFLPRFDVSINFASVWLVEILLSFLFVSVFLRTQKEPFFGIATGLTLNALQQTCFKISGSLLNPALALGACFVGWNEVYDTRLFLVVYVSGGFLGGILGGITHLFLEEPIG